MAKLSLSLSLSLLLAAGLSAQAPSAGLPGRTPGTERWIVSLKGRSFDLRAELQQVRQGVDTAERRRRMGQVKNLMSLDHAPIATLVTAAGGRPGKSSWSANAIEVEIAPSLVPVLRAHPRVRSVVPVRSYLAEEVVESGAAAGGAALPTSVGVTLDRNNHAVQEARAILTPHVGAYAAKGGGAVWALFDTGVDADAGAAAGTQPHPSFLDGANSQSRILHHLRAGTIDCNNIFYGASAPLFGFADNLPSSSHSFGYRPTQHSVSSMHGTAMASIAVGRAHSSFAEGHAPESMILDVSISSPPNLVDYWSQWTATDSAYIEAVDILLSAAIEMDIEVDALNISYGGPPDPSHPVCSAIDFLVMELDVLVVSAAGNDRDETGNSLGVLGGLSVGSVHTRVDEGVIFGYQRPFNVMHRSSRGPLWSDSRRYFPDVSATGAGKSLDFNAPLFSSPGVVDQRWADYTIEVPKIDMLDPLAIVANTSSNPAYPFGAPFPGTAIRYSAGTSQAAAQVSGAAALYRAARKQLVPGGASAQETRAAILVSTIGGAQGGYTWTNANPPELNAPGSDQDAYRSRNAVGVGYVRDDLLAEFAVRTASNTINARHVQKVIQTQAPVAVEVYDGLVPGRRYVVAACWPKQPMDTEGVPFENVDLTVKAGTSILARSWSPANFYERLVFVCPQGVSSVDLELRAVDFGGHASIPVDIAAREFDPDRDPGVPGHQATEVVAATGFYEHADTGAACLAASRSLLPTRTIPVSYSRAYGSGMESSVRLQNLGSAPWGNGVHIVLSAEEVGAATSIGGLAFRLWRPFQVASNPLVVKRLRVGQRAGSAVDRPSLDMAYGPGDLDVLNDPFALGVDISPGFTGVAQWVPQSFDEFALVMPFEVPFHYVPALIVGGVSQPQQLHIWLELEGGDDVQVEAAKNTYWPPVGMATRDSSGAVYWYGHAPIMALLPAPVVANRNPLLMAFGEPIVGRGIHLQVRNAPAGSVVGLIFGSWSPNLVPGVCVQHLALPFFVNYSVTNAAGLARWNVNLPTQVGWVHSDHLAMQAVIETPSGLVMTNALRAVLGGGL